MKHVALAAYGLILFTQAPAATAGSSFDNQRDSYVVAQNAKGQKNPNHKKKKQDNVNVGVSNNGVSVGVRNDGTSVRMGPSGPSVSTKVPGGPRVSVGANGRFRIGF